MFESSIFVVCDLRRIKFCKAHGSFVSYYWGGGRGGGLSCPGGCSPHLDLAAKTLLFSFNFTSGCHGCSCAELLVPI